MCSAHPPTLRRLHVSFPGPKRTMRDRGARWEGGAGLCSPDHPTLRRLHKSPSNTEQAVWG